MKKFFTLIAAAILAVGAYADRQVLWQSDAAEGTKTPANWAHFATCENVPTLKAGDVIYVTFASKTDEDSYPQVNLVAPDWSNLTNFGLHSVTTFPYEASYTIVQNAADKINNNGHSFWLAGAACYVSKIELEPTTSTEDMSKAIWIGNVTLGSGWDNGFEISSSLLANAEIGSEIRIYYTDKGSGFNCFPKAGWSDFKPALDKQDKGDYTSFVLTEDVLKQINDNGSLRISGSEYTVTHIDVYPATVYGDAKNITWNDADGFIAASQFDGMSVETKIELTYNVSGGTPYIYWGPCCIADNINQNADGAKKYDTGFGIKNDGDNTVKFTLADIADILNSNYDPSTGKYGAYWDVWGFTSNGECKTTRVSIVAYDCLTSENKFTANADAVVDAIRTATTASPKVMKAMKNGRITISANGSEYNVAGQLIK